MAGQTQERAMIVPHRLFRALVGHLPRLCRTGREDKLSLRPIPDSLFKRPLLAFAAGLLASIASPAMGQQIGPASGLALPRYVSLKSDRVNLREGPSKEHRTIWVFQRAGLPVEITAEFEVWRKVRDSEGAEGWVLHSLLSGRRTALIAPWKDGTDSILYEKPNTDSTPVAKLQPNVIVTLRKCDKTWCYVTGEGFKGYLRQSELWGVYPDEIIE
jgi:SH3-like domain-containing protein